MSWPNIFLNLCTEISTYSPVWVGYPSGYNLREIPFISYSMNICSNTQGNRGFSAIKIAPLQFVGFLPIPLQRDIYAPRRYLCTARGAPDEPYVSSYSRACYLLSRGPGEEPVDEDVVTERERDVCVRWRGGAEERRSHPPTHHVWSDNESITT